MTNRKKILYKAFRISRGLALATGAVVICAVVLGAATVALAAVPGDPFRLGQVNAINKVTKLAGKAPSPRLVIDNNGSGVALRLLVEPGKPPMQVNSSAKVARLNADRLDNKNASDFYAAGSKVADSDKLDGLDQSAFLRTDGKAADADNADRLDGYHASEFLTTVIYGRQASATGPGGPNQVSYASLSCLPGDILINGGYVNVDTGTQVRSSYSNDLRTWFVEWSNDATVDSIGIRIGCSQIRQ